jgi:hypothetical protein
MMSTHASVLVDSVVVAINGEILAMEAILLSGRDGPVRSSMGLGGLWLWHRRKPLARRRLVAPVRQLGIVAM